MKPKTNTNPVYAKVYANDNQGERGQLRAAKRQAQADFDARILDEQKRRQPRARKNFKMLPDETLEAIREEFSGTVERIKQIEKQLDDADERREQLFSELAPMVHMEPCAASHRLQTSSSYTYSTQGWGAMKYAKGVLVPLEDHLKRLGFEVHIRQVNHKRIGSGSFSTDHCEWELWANCEPWMFDAAERLLTLDEAVASWKSRSINFLVYNPFLADSYSL
jgi:hypothetical protein